MYDKTNKNGTIYSLTITISKISLKVRFPCSICCSIKLDGQQRQILGEGELRNGEATLKLAFTTQLFIPFRKEINGLSDKKCSLLIYLKSSSGRIPAGSVSVLLQRAETRPNRQISRIQKCPDKNALIQFQVKLDKLEEKRDGYNYSSYKQLSFRQEASRINLKNNKSLEKSIDEKNTSIGHMMNSQVQKNQGKETISILRRVASKRQGQVRSSIFQSYYSGEIKAKDSEKMFGLEREIDNYKSKLMILESQLASKSSRFSELEKDQKNFLKKHEQLQLQFKAAASKLEYAQKNNRDLNNTIKQLKQRLQEDKLAFQNSIKRWQIRQNSYKQQIKGLTEKLYNSQNQKQRMVFQKNINSNQFQGRQKKIRQAFKQKQKKMLEQRTSFLKKIDTLQKDISKQRQQITDTKTKNTDNTQYVHELKLLLETCDAQKQRFRGECSDLRFQMTKLKNQKKILQENMDSMAKFNEQRRNFRKQISEKDIQITQIRDKLTNIQSHLSRIKSQNQQLQKQLREKTNEIKIIDRDLNLISKQNKILVSQIADKQSKISSLMQQLQLQMKKTKFYEGSLQQMQQQFQIKQDSLQMEIRQHRNMKKMLEDEIQKLNQQSQITNQQLAEHVKDIQQLELILEEKSEQISKMQSQLIQINNLNQQLQMEKLQLGEDRKYLQDNYQNKMEQSQEQIKILNMKIIALSQSYEKSISEARVDIKVHYQKTMILEKQLRQKEEKLIKFTQKIVQLNNQIQISNKQKEFSQNNILQIKKQINHLLENISKYKKQISDKQLVIQSLRNHIENLQQQSNQISNKKQIIKSDYTQLQSSYQKLQRQIYQQRQIAKALLQSIYEIACRKNPKQLKQIEGANPSIDIKSKQIIKKITANYKQAQAKLQDKEKKINQLLNQKKLLLEQKQRKQSDLIHADHHLTLLRKNTNEYGQEITSKANQIKRLNEQLAAKQQQILSITQTSNKKFISLSSHLSQKNHEIAELNQKIEEFQNQIGQLGVQIQQLNEYIKKSEKDFKNMDLQQRSKLGYIDINLRNQMERANNLETEKSGLEKQLRQQKQSLRKVMRQLQSKCYEVEDIQLKFQENQSIIKMRQAQNKRLKEANSEYKRLFEAFFTTDLQFSSQGTPINLKIDKYFSQPVNKQLQSLKQRVKNFYQIFVDISVSNFQLGKINSQNKKLIKQQSQKLEQVKQNQYIQLQATSKQLFELKSALQTKNKQIEKQMDSKQQLIKTIDEQRAGIDILKRFCDQLSKQISSLQKQKKASIFVLSPLKQLHKKIDDQVTQILKLLSSQAIKNKREVDIAKLRMKKSISKKEDLSTSFRPF